MTEEVTEEVTGEVTEEVTEEESISSETVVTEATDTQENLEIERCPYCFVTVKTTLLRHLIDRRTKCFTRLRHPDE